MFILIKLNNILKFNISRSTMMATFHLLEGTWIIYFTMLSPSFSKKSQSKNLWLWVCEKFQN